MKFNVLLFLPLICCIGSGILGVEGEKYSGKFESIDIDEVIQSDRLLKNYINCILDKGTCTPAGTDLKRIVPDALQTSCQKCSDKQKEKLEKVLDYMLEQKPEMFKEIQSKFDPERKYLTKYEQKHMSTKPPK